MPLPKIATPTYELILPSTEKKITYRPFLVKEEKLLIIAQQSEDPEQITNAIKTVIKNCIITRGVKVEQLSSFDIEYLFLNLRARSIGEIIEVMIVCPDDNETKVKVEINIDDIKFKPNPEHSKDIKLDDTLTLRMRYPSLSQFLKNNFNLSENEVGVEDTFEIIASCIDTVYSDDTVWAADECTDKELMQFIESLSPKHFKMIQKFFDTMPELTHEVEVFNPKTEIKSKYTIEGLSNFFTSG